MTFGRARLALLIRAQTTCHVGPQRKLETVTRSEFCHQAGQVKLHDADTGAESMSKPGCHPWIDQCVTVERSMDVRDKLVGAGTFEEKPASPHFQRSVYVAAGVEGRDHRDGNRISDVGAQPTRPEIGATSG